jgi:hypothetical protein
LALYWDGEWVDLQCCGRSAYFEGISACEQAARFTGGQNSQMRGILVTPINPGSNPGTRYLFRLDQYPLTGSGGRDKQRKTGRMS